MLSAGVLFQSTKYHFGSSHRKFFKAKLDSVGIFLSKEFCVCKLLVCDITSYRCIYLVARVYSCIGLHVSSDCCVPFLVILYILFNYLCTTILMVNKDVCINAVEQQNNLAVNVRIYQRS